MLVYVSEIYFYVKFGAEHLHKNPPPQNNASARLTARYASREVEPYGGKPATCCSRGSQTEDREGKKKSAGDDQIKKQNKELPRRADLRDFSTCEPAAIYANQATTAIT